MNALASFALRKLRSMQGRFTAGIAVFAALSWLLWPDPHWTFRPDAGGALVVALFAWIFSCIGEDPAAAGVKWEAPLPSDIRLFERFEAVMSEPQRRFLRDHDFGATFRGHQLDGVREIAETFHGAAFEFSDPNLEAVFAPLKAAAAKLSTYVAFNTWPVRDTENLFTSKPDVQTEALLERQRVRVGKMNSDASELAEMIDNFTRLARRSMRL